MLVTNNFDLVLNTEPVLNTPVLNLNMTSTYICQVTCNHDSLRPVQLDQSQGDFLLAVNMTFPDDTPIVIR